MTVRTYYATDTGAPVLDGQLGSLVGVLDLCLVTGYGTKLPAGWSVPFFDTNKTVFRNGVGSNQFHLRVDDNQNGDPRHANLIAYETMSDVDTGTGRFPSTAQASNGLWILKSDIASDAARDWMLVATENIFYLLINAHNITGFSDAGFTVFGDAVSYGSGDAYNTLLIARSDSGTLVGAQDTMSLVSIVSVTCLNHYAARSFTQIGGSVAIGKHGDASKKGMTFPNPVDGGIYLSPYWVTEIGAIRGILPGLWYVAPNASDLTHGDTFTGSGDLAGKTFQIVKSRSSVFALEISDTW